MSKKKKTQSSAVENIQLGVDMDRRIALASVRIGEVLIHGVAVWRSRHGRLRVFFPSYKSRWGSWEEAIELNPELRSEAEASVIASYKEAKKRAKNTE